MKIHVLLCDGIVCSGLGALEIQKAVQSLCDRHPVDLDLTIHHCCSRCEREEGLCPSVKVNDAWLVNATPESVREQLEKEISKGKLSAESQGTAMDDPYAKYFEEQE